MLRREFLSLAAAAAQPGKAVRHVLLTASHDRLLVKASFAAALGQAPVLRAGKRMIPGVASDTPGRFWRFDVSGLKPGEEHTLQLLSGRKELNAPWVARTFPDPASVASRFRLLVYTCAGGDENGNFLPLSTRQRLLKRALSLQPDAAVGNGDHIYWDLRQTGSGHGVPPEIVRERGIFQRDLPVSGTANEAVLANVGDAQIASLYGTLFQSTPVFFIQDDHDYFENDDANANMVTYPPDHFMIQCGRGIRRRYFPEFLPDAMRPAGLPGASAMDTAAGTGESFGTIRWGKLAEVLLYDCRRFLTLAGPNAVYVPREAEAWIASRLKDPTMRHLVQIPSLPPMFSAGKWGDWYPDFLDANGELSTKVAKPYWQPGWAAQHDRLMKMTSEQTSGRVPLFLGGDMHAHGYGRMVRAGTTSLEKNPVHVHLSGCVSTKDRGFPSGGRRTPPKPATHIEADMKIKATEENGFLILDFSNDSIRIRAYKWRPPAPLEAIDTLEPFHDITIPRTA